MSKQQVNAGWTGRGKKRSTRKRKSFLKRTICKTRSLKPDYRPTMTQSLMFIPVIRCEEEDLYFIVVECIKPALCLLLRLPASLGNIFLLLRPGVIPTWRKQRCLQPAADQPYNGSSIVSDTTRGKIPSIQYKAFTLQRLASHRATLGLGGCSPDLSLTSLLVSWSELDCIGLS